MLSNNRFRSFIKFLFTNFSVNSNIKINIKTKIISTELNTFGNVLLIDKCNKWSKAVNASFTSLIRKNIQARQTKLKVKNSLINEGIWNFIFFFAKKFSIIIILPCSNPQMIKFQRAPCHNPLRKNTTKMLNIHRALVVLFPPNGIYR